MDLATHIRNCVAEFAATFILIASGCGAAVIHGQTGQVTAVEVSIVFGVAVSVLIYAVGHISHAHMNPAVSIALAATRQFPVREVPGYIIAQVVGATLASVLLGVTFGRAALPASLTLPARGATSHAFWMEAVSTGILMFVIMGTATDGRAVAPAAALAIGGVVVVLDVVAGPVSGGSLNPSRSLGPAIAVGDFTAMWVYLVAPVVGALAGAAGYQVIRGPGSALPVTAAVTTNTEARRPVTTEAIAAGVRYTAIPWSSPSRPGRHAGSAQGQMPFAEAVQPAAALKTSSLPRGTEPEKDEQHWAVYWVGYRDGRERLRSIAPERAPAR